MKWKTRLGIVVATVAVTLGLCQLGLGGLRIRKSDAVKAIQNLKTGNPQQKASAADTLGRIGSIRVTYVKPALPLLKRAVTMEKDANVRAAAARALGKIGVEPKETVMLLMKVLKKDKDNAVKIGAMEGLARFPREGKVALPELRKMMKDKKNKQLSRTARNVMRSLRGQ